MSEPTLDEKLDAAGERGLRIAVIDARNRETEACSTLAAAMGSPAIALAITDRLANPDRERPRNTADETGVRAAHTAIGQAAMGFEYPDAMTAINLVVAEIIISFKAPKDRQAAFNTFMRETARAIENGSALMQRRGFLG